MAKKKTPKASVKKSSSGSDPDDAKIDFESALQEIESIVTLLEGGDLGLAESIEKYEFGIKQLKRCHRLLDSAQQRVTVLSGFDADGNPITEDLAKGSRADRDSGDGNGQDSTGLF